MRITNFLISLTGRGKKSQEVRRQPSTAPSYGARSPYHAVAVVPGADCCAAAKALAGERMLSRTAPPLPLPGCSKPEGCGCHFQKFNDRRHQGDRRAVWGGQRWYAGIERRFVGTTGGRRATDH